MSVEHRHLLSFQKLSVPHKTKQAPQYLDIGSKYSNPMPVFWFRIIPLAFFICGLIPKQRT